MPTWANNYDQTQILAEIARISLFSVENYYTLNQSNHYLSGLYHFRISISNNNSNGYSISAQSQHQGYLMLNNTNQHNLYRKISYQLHCDNFYDSNGSIIYAQPKQQLTSAKVLYDSTLYTTAATVNAKPYCHITSTDTLAHKFSGNYQDTITFTLYDD